MPAPLEFVIEFATDKAKDALRGLASTTKAYTTDLVANILAPLSPSSLLTQIGQQGLGINGLAANAVSMGLGMMQNGALGNIGVQASSMGAQFQAESSAMDRSVSMARGLGEAGFHLTDEQRRNLFQLNYRMAKSGEDEARGMQGATATVIKNADAERLKQFGNAVWNDPSVQQAREYANFYGGVGLDLLKFSMSPLSYPFASGGGFSPGGSGAMGF